MLVAALDEEQALPARHETRGSTVQLRHKAGYSNCHVILSLLTIALFIAVEWAMPSTYNDLNMHQSGLLWLLEAQ